MVKWHKITKKTVLWNKPRGCLWHDVLDLPLRRFERQTLILTSQMVYLKAENIKATDMH